MPVIPNPLEHLLFVRLNIGPGPVLDLLGAAMFRTATSAARLGVFEALAQEPLAPTALARQLSVDAHVLDRMLALLATGGYVQQQGAGGRYRNSAMTRRWLLQSSSQSLGAWFELWDGVVADLWSGLDAAVRTAAPAPHMDAWLNERPGGWATFNQAMRLLASQSADEVAQKAGVDPGARSLIDLGGSHGLYTLAFLRRCPEMTGTVLDQPRALEATELTMRDLAPSEGLRHRLHPRAGDFTRDDLGGPYDVALLANVIHYQTADGNRDLLARVAAALNPGGVLVILDQLYGSAPTPLAGMLIKLLALQYTVALGSDLFRWDQLAGWCIAAGLESPRKRGLRTAPGQVLMTARKPS